MNTTNKTKIEKISLNNITSIKELYTSFSKKAKSDYKYDFAPVPFKDFVEIINSKVLEGYVLFDNEEAKAFTIYSAQLNEGIEINIIHGEKNPKLNEYKFLILQKLINDLGGNYKVISYPMLGIQDQFVREITHLGFNLIGQAVVRFNFKDETGLKILSSYIIHRLPEGYEITDWKQEYLNPATEVIHETFKNAGDAEFDPRFTSLAGTKDALIKVVHSQYGDFSPEATKVLLYKGKVVGICFITFSTPQMANIPLIGILKDHKRKGFGCHLMKLAIETLLSKIQQKEQAIFEVNATLDTDNYPATRTYRNLGFQEDFNYPHAYLKKPNNSMALD